jgi:hypothetical protein
MTACINMHPCSSNRLAVYYLRVVAYNFPYCNFRGPHVQLETIQLPMLMIIHKRTWMRWMMMWWCNLVCCRFNGASSYIWASFMCVETTFGLYVLELLACMLRLQITWKTYVPKNYLASIIREKFQLFIMVCFMVQLFDLFYLWIMGGMK